MPVTSIKAENAQAGLAWALAQLALQNPQKSIGKQISFAGAVSVYLRDYALDREKVSIYDDRNRLKIVQSFLGDIQLAEFDQDRFDGLVSYLRQDRKVSKGTANRYWALIHCMMRFLKKRGYMVHALEFDKYEENKKTIRMPVKHFLKLIGSEYFMDPHNDYRENLRRFLIVGYMTGMRSSEIFRLQFAHIDWQKKFIFVEKTKSKKPRTIAVGPVFLRWLSQIRGKTIGENVIEYRSGPIHSIKTSWHTLLRYESLTGLGYTPHVLRHSYASGMAESGMVLSALKDQLGHSEIEMTNRYTHISSDHLVEDASRFESVVFPEGHIDI